MRSSFMCSANVNIRASSLLEPMIRGTWLKFPDSMMDQESEAFVDKDVESMLQQFYWLRTVRPDATPSK